MRSDDQADGAVYAGDFFDGGGIFDVAEAGAAILLGENDAKKAHLRELGHDFDRKVGDFIPLHDVGSDFTFGKFANAAAEMLLFIGKVEVHVASWVSFGRKKQL